MKKNYRFDTELNKIKLIARGLWMGYERGEGELEIENQGRSRISSFTQETVAIGQHKPRIGDTRPKLRFTSDTQVLARVSSAGCTQSSDSTPHFLSSNENALKVVSSKLQNQLAKLLLGKA